MTLKINTLPSLLVATVMSAGLGMAIAQPSRAHGIGHSHRPDPQIAEAAPQAVTFTVQQVRDNIYVISGSNGAGNVGVLMGEVGPILIDSQMPGLGSDLKRCDHE